MFIKKMVCSKVISVLITLSFVITNPSQASLTDVIKPSQTNSQNINPTEQNIAISGQFPITDPEKILIAENIGKVKEIFKGENSKLVINIQDAHCNFEAQMNIAQILDTLVKDNGLTFIALEGSTGEIDPSLFTTFPDEEIRKEVATYFMKKGKINGAEYLAITSKDPLELYGVETKEYYLANLAAFTNTLEGREKARDAIAKIEDGLARLKGYIYSKGLSEFDAKALAFKQDKLELIDFCRYLKETAESKKISIDNNFPNLALLYRTMDIEKALDFNKVEEERSKVITALEKLLTQKDLEDLFLKSVNFKSAKISAGKYYTYLRELAKSYGVDYAQYPNLSLYTDYLVIYEKVDTFNLFKEIASLENAIKEGLFKNEDQRLLDKLSKDIRVLKDMFNISLAREDVEYYQKNKNDFRAQVFLDFIKKEAKKYKTSFNYDADFSLIDKCIPDLENFYRIADTRDDAIVENTLKKMDEDRLEVAALITGGYHTEGIAQRLRERGISYIVISPRITKPDTENPYLSILTSEKLPYKEMLKGGPERLAINSRLERSAGQDDVAFQRDEALTVFLRAELSHIVTSRGGWDAIDRDEIKRELQRLAGAWAKKIPLFGGETTRAITALVLSKVDTVIDEGRTLGLAPLRRITTAGLEALPETPDGLFYPIAAISHKVMPGYTGGELSLIVGITVPGETLAIINPPILIERNLIDVYIKIYQKSQSGEGLNGIEKANLDILTPLLGKSPKDLIRELKDVKTSLYKLAAILAALEIKHGVLKCAHRGDFPSLQPIPEPDVDFGELERALDTFFQKGLTNTLKGTLYLIPDGRIKTRTEGASTVISITFRKSIDGLAKPPITYEIVVSGGVPEVIRLKEGSAPNVPIEKLSDGAFCNMVYSLLNDYLLKRSAYEQIRHEYLVARREEAAPKKEEEEKRNELARAVKNNAPQDRQDALKAEWSKAAQRLKAASSKVKAAEDRMKDAQAALNTAKAKAFPELHHLLVNNGEYREFLLGDYLGGDAMVDKIFEKFWSVKRFQNFIRVFQSDELRARLKRLSEEIDRFVENEEKKEFARVDKSVLPASELDVMRKRLMKLKDMSWFINQETLGLAQEVRDLAGDTQSLSDDAAAKIPGAIVQELVSAIKVIRSIKRVLRAIDRRLETRGRDSLGLTTTLTFRDKKSYEDFLRKLEGVEIGPRDKERLDKIRAGLETKYKTARTEQGRERIRRTIEKFSSIANLRDEFEFRAGYITVPAVGESKEKEYHIGDLTNFSIRTDYRPDLDPRGHVSVTFVYKTAVRVGALGENAAQLVANFKQDRIIKQVLGLPEEDITTYSTLAHTRWASVGGISEPNCHPEDNRGVYTYENRGETFEMICDFNTGHSRYYGKNGNIFVVLNGDINNFNEKIGMYPNLTAEYEEAKGEFEKRWISTAITNDTKLIPLRIEHYLQKGHDLTEAFWLACKDFSGSFSIQMTSDLEPSKMFAAQFGEGQELNLCVSKEGVYPTSEAHGAIEETQEYINLKEIIRTKKLPGGVIAVYDQSDPPLPERIAYYPFSNADEKMPSPQYFANADMGHTPLTGRDTYLPQGFSHYLLKELNEGPDMLDSTLLGKVGIEHEGPQIIPFINLDERTLPSELVEKFRSGKIKRIIFTGMGTADTAGGACATITKSYLDGLSRIAKKEFGIEVISELATNASAFDVSEDMSDTLIIAISQSGGTADTNTYLSLATQEPTLRHAAGRGASLLGIINKRDSDGDKTIRDAGGGVIYTGTGRDVEIAVASTKAFYAQIAAGTVLAMALVRNLAEAQGKAVSEEFDKVLIEDIKVLHGFQDNPSLVEKMKRLLGDIKDNDHHPLKEAASYWPLHRTEWKIVGGGQSFYAAKEGRIKLGELDYRSFPFDILRGDEPRDVLERSWVVVNLADMEGYDREFLNKAANRVHELLRKGAAVTVVTHEGDQRFNESKFAGYLQGSKKFDGHALLNVVYVPRTSEKFATILNTVVNHSLGYYIAVAMDQRAKNIADGKYDDVVKDIISGRFNTGFPAEYSMRFFTLYMALRGELSLDAAGKYLGRQQLTMEEVRKEFNAFSLKCREKLTRSIDAVLHQAKFVTVGATRQAFELYIGSKIDQAFADPSHPLFKGDYSGILKELYKEYAQNIKPQIHIVSSPLDSSKTRVFVIFPEESRANIETFVRDAGLDAIGGSDSLLIKIPSSNTVIAAIDINAPAGAVKGKALETVISRSLARKKIDSLASEYERLNAQFKEYPSAMQDVPESLRAMVMGKVGVSAIENLVLGPDIRLTNDNFQEALKQKIEQRKIKKIIIVGEGVSNAAGDAIKAAIEGYVRDVRNLLTKEIDQLSRAGMGIDLSKYDFNIEVTSVSSLEGASFEMKDDMSDTLVIGISSLDENVDAIRFMKSACVKGAELLGIAGDSAKDVALLMRNKNFGVLEIKDNEGLYYNRVAAGTIYAIHIARLLAGAIYRDIRANENVDLKLLDRVDDIVVDDIVELVYGIPAHMCSFLVGVEEARRAGANHPLFEAAKFWPHKKPDWKLLGAGPAYAVSRYGAMQVALRCGKFAGVDFPENYKHVDTSTESYVILNLANVRGLGDTFNLDIISEVLKWQAHESFVTVFAADGDNRFDDLAISRTSVTGEVIDRSSKYNVIHLPKTSERFSMFLLALGNDLLIRALQDEINKKASEVKDARTAIISELETIKQAQPNLSNDVYVSDPDFQVFIRNCLKKIHLDMTQGLYNAHLPSDFAARFNVFYLVLTGALDLREAAGYLGREYTGENMRASLYVEFITFLAAMENYLRTGKRETQPPRTTKFAHAETLAIQLPRETIERLHIVSVDDKFYYTAEGAMIAREVNLSNIKTAAENIARSVILGKETAIEEGAIIKACLVEDCEINNGAVVLNSVLKTEWPSQGSDFEDWAYNARYSAKGGKTTIGKNCRIENATLLNAKVGDDTEIIRSSFKGCDIGAKNKFTDVKGSLFHSEEDVIVDGPTEISEAWFGWGFRHTRVMTIGDLKFERDPEAYIEGVFPNEIVTVELDEKGEPVIERDDTGKPVELKNDAGQSVRSEDGTPIYKYRYKTWKNIPALVVLGWHTIYCSYDGKLNPPKSRVLCDIDGKESRRTKDKESSKHYYYLTEPFSVVAPAQGTPGVRVIGLSQHPDDTQELYAYRNATYLTACSYVGGTGREELDGREHWGHAYGHNYGLSPSQAEPAHPFTYMPILIVNFGRELEKIYDKRSMDKGALDGLFEAILRTKEVNTLKRPDLYRMHIESRVWRYEGGKFLYWGYNSYGAMESHMFADLFRDKIRGDWERLKLGDDLNRLVGYSPEQILHYEPVFTQLELDSFSDTTKGGSVAPEVAEDIAAFGKNVYIHPTAIIGPNVKLGNNVIIGPNVELLGEVEIGDNTEVYFVKAEGIVQIGADCVVAYAVLNGKTGRVAIGNNSTVTNTNLSASTLGDGTKSCDRALISDSALGRGNTLEPFATVMISQFGNDNIIGSLRSNCVVGNGTTDHHLASRHDFEYAQLQDVPDKTETGHIPNQTNFSAGCMVEGTMGSPVVIQGGFIGANAVVGHGANVNMGFAKNKVPAGTYIGPFDFFDGTTLHPGDCHDPTRFGFQYIARHGFSKIATVMKDADKPAADRFLEVRLVESMREELKQVDRISPDAFAAIAASVNRLAENVMQDLAVDGNCPDIETRIRLVNITLGILDEYINRYRDNAVAPYLRGIRRNAAMLVGCYRIRNGYFTEGFWDYEGDIVDNRGWKRELWAWYPDRQIQGISFASIDDDRIALSLYRLIDMGIPRPAPYTHLEIRDIVTAGFGVRIVNPVESSGANLDQYRKEGFSAPAGVQELADAIAAQI